MDFNLIAIFIAFLGVPAGVLLAYFTKEEEELIKNFVIIVYYIITGLLFIFAFGTSMVQIMLLITALLVFFSKSIRPVAIGILVGMGRGELLLGIAFVYNVFAGSILYWDKKSLKNTLQWQQLLMPVTAIIVYLFSM